MNKEDLEKFDKDNELWDSKQLGASAKHAKPVSDEEDKALDEAMGLQLLSFSRPRFKLRQQTLASL